MAAPSSATDTGVISLRDLIDFISHVADCYPDITKNFPQELIDILSQHHTVLEPELREKIVGSLVLLKKKEIIDSSLYGAPYPLPRRVGLLLIHILQTSTYALPNSYHDSEQESSTIPLSKDYFGSPFLEFKDSEP